MAKEALTRQAVPLASTVCLHNLSLVASKHGEVLEIVEGDIMRRLVLRLQVEDAISNEDVAQSIGPQVVPRYFIVPQVLREGAIYVNSKSSKVGNEAASLRVGVHDPHLGVGLKASCVVRQVHNSKGGVQIVPVGTLPAIEHDVLAVPDA